MLCFWHLECNSHSTKCLILLVLETRVVGVSKSANAWKVHPHVNGRNVDELSMSHVALECFRSWKRYTAVISLGLFGFLFNMTLMVTDHDIFQIFQRGCLHVLLANSLFIIKVNIKFLTGKLILELWVSKCLLNEAKFLINPLGSFDLYAIRETCGLNKKKVYLKRCSSLCLYCTSQKSQ